MRWLQTTTRVLALLLSLIAITGALVLGTETRLLFFWPSAALLGVASTLLVISGPWQLRSPTSNTCLLSTLLLSSYLLIRCLYSPVEAYAREDFFIIGACFLTYTLAATIFSDPRLRNALLWIIVFITIGNLAIGFIHFSGKWNFHIVPHYMRTFGEGQRIGGFFNNPNHLAAALSMISLWILGTACFARLNPAIRMLLLFLSLANIVAIALTISRGGLMGLTIGILVLMSCAAYLIYKAYPQALLRLTIGGGILLTLGALVITGVFSEQLIKRASAIGHQTEVADPRLVIWQAALAQHAENPLLGAGSRMFYEGCIQYRTPNTPAHVKDALFVHNDWLQLLSEYGWIGLTLALLTLAPHLLNALRFLHWHVTERFPRTAIFSSRNLGHTVGSIAALSAGLSHAIVEFHFHIPAIALLGSLFMGILANPGFNHNHTTTKPIHIPLLRPLLKLTMLLLSACMIYGATTFGRADYYTELATLHPIENNHGQTRIEWYDRAIAIDPNNANTWYERGLTKLNTLNDLPPAETIAKLASSLSDLKQSQTLNPHNLFNTLALADALDASNQEAAALTAIHTAIHLAPTSMSPRLSLAIHHHRHQRWEQAEAAYFWAMDAQTHVFMDAYVLYQALLKDWQP